VNPEDARSNRVGHPRRRWQSGRLRAAVIRDLRTRWFESIPAHSMGLIAQWTEHCLPKAGVGGSSPSETTAVWLNGIGARPQSVLSGFDSRCRLWWPGAHAVVFRKRIPVQRRWRRDRRARHIVAGRRRDRRAGQVVAGRRRDGRARQVVAGRRRYRRAGQVVAGRRRDGRARQVMARWRRNGRAGQVVAGRRRDGRARRIDARRRRDNRARARGAVRTGLHRTMLRLYARSVTAAAKNIFRPPSDQPEFAERTRVPPARTRGARGVLCKRSRYAKNLMWLLAAGVHRIDFS
jgi:hypothetical protein